MQGITVSLAGVGISDTSFSWGSKGASVAIGGGVLAFIGSIFTIDYQKYIKRAGLKLINSGIGLTRKF